MGKHFNAPVITPLVKASAQHAAFAEGDIVFDWTSFDIPKGGARLLGATITCRHNKVANKVGCFDLVFAKDGGTNTALTSLGTGNAIYGVTNFSNTDIIGFLPGKLADVSGEGVAATAASVQTTSASSPIILDPLATNTASGANVGYDRYYIAGLASGALDLRGLVETDAGIDVSGEDGTITDIDGTSPELVFAAGDILHVEDDIIVGEVASASDTPNIVFKFDGSTSTNHAVVAGNQSYTVPADIAAWRIQNGAGAAGDLLDNDIFYNIFPLRITLHFEK
jgi:hypothetical protein